MADKTVKVVVVTPEKAVLDETAEFVVVPMIDGELGVMVGRSPLIGRLGAGELRLTTGTATKRYFIEAGFVQVRANVVTVLTANALSSEKVSREAAQQAAQAAEALPSTNNVERANKAKARERASGMAKVASKNSA